jgi:uncharacterized membrane protein YjjP (DUF1212 family)
VAFAPSRDPQREREAMSVGHRERTAIDGHATPQDSDVAVQLLLRLAEQLHRYGAPSHRVEATLVGLGQMLDLEVSIFCVPTMIEVAVGRGASQRSLMLRVEPGSPDLARLESMLSVIDGLRSGRLSPRAALDAVNEVADAPRRPRTLLTLAALAGTGAAAATIFRGGVREIIAAAIICATAGLVASLLGRHPSRAALADFLAGAIVTILAGIAASVIAPTSVSIVTIASLIVFLPGLGLATAMNELAMRQLVSGTSRLMGAIMTFVAIGFGAAIGDRIAKTLVSAPIDAPPLSLPAWSLFPALLVAGASLTVLYRAHRRDVGWVLLGTMTGFFGAAFGEQLLGPALGVCVGATLVGLAGNLVARLRPKPSALLIIPGITLLVPGSAGFRGLHALMQNDVVSGIGIATTAVMVAGSLVAGLLVANALLPAPRGL